MLSNFATYLGRLGYHLKQADALDGFLRSNNMEVDPTKKVAPMIPASYNHDWQYKHTPQVYGTSVVGAAAQKQKGVKPGVTPADSEMKHTNISRTPARITTNVDQREGNANATTTTGYGRTK